MHPAAMSSWDSGGAENLTGASGRGLCSPSNIFLWILHLIQHLRILSITPSIKCSPCMCNTAGQRRGLPGSLLITRSWGRGTRNPQQITFGCYLRIKEGGIRLACGNNTKVNSYIWSTSSQMYRIVSTYMSNQSWAILNTGTKKMWRVDDGASSWRQRQA